MGMGQNDDVNGVDPFPPQVGGDDVFPNIEDAVRKTAAVDEHDLVGGETNQGRTSLADVDSSGGEHTMIPSCFMK